MKHILNDLSNNEKNSILEQYSGEMSINTSNFKKLIKTKSGDVKPFPNKTIEDSNTSKDFKSK